MNTQTIPVSIPRKHTRIIVAMCMHIHSRRDKTEYKGHIHLFLFQAVPLLLDHRDKFISPGCGCIVEELWV